MGARSGSNKLMSKISNKSQYNVISFRKWNINHLNRQKSVIRHEGNVEKYVIIPKERLRREAHLSKCMELLIFVLLAL